MSGPTITQAPVGKSVTDTISRGATVDTFSETFGSSVPEGQATPLYRGATRDDFADAILEEEDRNVRRQIAEVGGGEELYQQWETAKAYSKYYNVPATSVFDNIEQYDNEYFGQKPDYKTAPRAILDTAVAQATMMKVGKLYSEMNGWSLSALSGREEPEIQKEIDELMAKMPGLMTDIIPRSGLVNLGKMIAGAIPYTAEMVATAAVTGAVVGATGGAAAPAALAFFKSAAITTFGFAKGFEIMSGMEYSDMIANGVDKDVAKKWAPISGAALTAVEQVLGIESFMTGSLSSKMIRGVANKLATKIGVSGALSAAAKKAGKNLVGDAAAFAARKTAFGILVAEVTEPVEEGMQALLSSLTRYAAESISEEGSIKDPMTIRKAAKDIGQSMYAALITAPFLGVAGHIAAGIKNKEEAMAIASLATSMNKDDFAVTISRSGVLNDSGLSKEEQRAISDQIYEKQNQSAEEEAVAGAEAARKASTSPASSENIVRKTDGTLRLEARAIASAEDGTQTVEYIAGAAKGKGDVYGGITVQVSDESVTIADSDIEGEYLGLSQEMLASSSELFFRPDI